ncbi:hypothetical protein SAMN05216598_4198 [Pseudomonas asplenii]|uniref:CcoQ/FixQ family Cbb3-type cytochrome c oxidase assembly chaperone n=1 Tax=Pseudomonas asplenii TaxID=53407 RepID=A0A1H1Y2Z9_9PSED|nr:hypothetical protein [Pseudomonas asplenii]UZE26722.1 hypothetical protein LOY63_15065 [Pseudomonas asplenii]SDT15787.1 hypothetical protein SAMN05216598_4198 [Pseudomonas asplenii]
MLEIGLNLMAVVSLYLGISYCLRDQSEKSLDEASLMLFSDDPEVAQRVEQATGKVVPAMVVEERPPESWAHMDM